MADVQFAAILDSAAGADPESLLSAPPAFIDFLPVALFACDVTGRILWANAKAAAIWGRDAEPGEQSAFFSSGPHVVGLDGALIAGDETAIDFALRTGEPVGSRTETILRPDGERRIVEVQVSPLRDVGGSLIGALACFHDVTERHDEDKSAREGERRLREILNALPAAIYTTDAEGRIDFFNEAAVEMSGRRPEIGRDSWCVTWKLYTTDGEPLPHDQCPMAVALREDRAIRGVEAVAERPDGSRIPFLPYPTPLHDSSGRLVGAVNMLVDISHRKDAETQQKLLFAELNHRIKNNMQMLHALLNAGMRETGSAEARTALADAAGRVASMAAAQTVLYRSDKLTRYDSAEFIESVCATARCASGANIRIEAGCDAGELSNDTAVPLALILNELLTNAAKYAAGPKGRVDVRVSLSRDEEQFTLTVDDEGPGFDLQDVRRRSSGLGLVAGLARQIGGGFIVKRLEGKGARCIVRFRDLG
ncbi:MAG TPA: PAS domain-containing protein [Allosphingosinicella sp.]|nr:PAS domain-containing protein [Allosphingosinicella sp.]